MKWTLEEKIYGLLTVLLCVMIIYVISENV